MSHADAPCGVAKTSRSNTGSARVDRFFPEHIQPSGPKAATVERVEQCLALDNRTARNVDQYGTIRHGVQHALVNQPVRLVGKRDGQHHKAAATHGLAQAVSGHAARPAPVHEPAQDLAFA